jgi:hypothetical protein
MKNKKILERLNKIEQRLKSCRCCNPIRMIDALPEPGMPHNMEQYNQIQSIVLPKKGNK